MKAIITYIVLFILVLLGTSCYKGKYEDLKADYAILEQNYLALSIEADELRAYVDALLDRIATLEALLEDNDAKEYIRTLEAKVIQQTALIQELEQQIADQLDVNDAYIAQLEEAVNSALTILDALDAEITALESEVATLTNQNTDLEAQVAQLTEAIAVYVQTIADLEQQILELGWDINDRDDQIAELNQAIERMQRQIDTLTNLVERLLDQISKRG